MAQPPEISTIMATSTHTPGGKPYSDCHKFGRGADMDGSAGKGPAWRIIRSKTTAETMAASDSPNTSSRKRAGWPVAMRDVNSGAMALAIKSEAVPLKKMRRELTLERLSASFVARLSKAFCGKS